MTRKKMDEFSFSYVPQLCRGLLHEEEDSLHLLLHPERPRWAVANQLGWEIAKLCDGKNNIGFITSIIAKRYGEDYSEVEKDVIEFIRSLGKARLLISNEKKDDKLLSTSGIKSIFLHLTNRCNLRCVHCYVASGVSKREELKTQKTYALIDELVRADGKIITFSGGEPLLHPDWFEILKYASENLRVTLNTNGALIDSRTADLLSQLKPYIQVSLDGPSPEVHDKIRGRGSFETTIKGIRLLQHKGLTDELIICMTLMKSNIACAPEMIDLVQQLEIPRLRFLSLHSQGRARSSWSNLDASLNEYLKWFNWVYYNEEAKSSSIEISGGLTGFLLYTPSEEEEPWCGVGRKIVIDSYGDVYPCALLMDENFCLGNVNRMNLEEIEESSKLKELTSICLSRKERIEQCSQCIWRNFCQGSCPALAFLHKGTFGAADDYCDFRQRLYRNSIFEIAKNRGVRKSKSDYTDYGC